MTTASDVLGDALTEPGQHPLLVERRDGHTSTADLAWWLGQPGARPPADFTALDHPAVTTARTVLDLGCCTGRHMRAFTGRAGSRGIRVAGIDSCPAAVAIAQSHGLDAHLADARTYTPPQPADAVLALGGGLGIAGTRDHVPAFLAHLATWLTPGGSIIASSVDWTATADQHHAWITTATTGGRYPGDVTLRLRHHTHTGPWFNWCWLDPDTLTTIAAQAGLHVTGIHRHSPAWYSACLTSNRT